MDQRARDLTEMDSRLFAKKGAIDSLHQTIAENFYPERATFTQTITLSEEFASHLTDFYPVLVRRELADQIGSMTRPQDRPWFKASVGQKKIQRDSGAQEFLEFMTDTQRAMLYSRDSGFRRAAKELENDYATFGMGYVSVSYTRDRSNLNYKSHHPKDCAGAENGDGVVDHVHRKCDMTARSLLSQFGEEKLPPIVKEAIKAKEYDKEFKVRHIFVPLDKYEPSRKFPKWAKWADIYLCEGKILRETPSATFDYVVPRWQTVSGSFYAFSPSTIVALPQARMLQRMMSTLIEAGEKRVDPPLVATADAVTSPISLVSGGITYLDAEYDERLGAGIRALDLGKDVGLGEALVRDQRSLLADAFFINKLAPLANRDKEVTAYEASQVVQEYIRSALPLFEPIEDEWTGALLDVSTQKIMRAGGFGPTDASGIPVNMPDSLLGSEIEFEFNNALTEARERQTVDAFMESAQLINVAAQMDQGAPQEVNMRDMFRDSFGAVPGGKVDWLNSTEDATTGREALAEQAQAQEAMNEVATGAEVVKGVAEAAQAVNAA